MKKFSAAIIILAVIFAAAFIAGCTGAQNTLDEPEITAEYLSGEYAAQLVRDGASVVFGSTQLTEDEAGRVIVNVAEKEFVEDASQPNGFYIADKNLESEYQLADAARATFLHGGESVPEAMGAGEFVEAARQDYDEFGAGDPDYIEHKLYDIYIMGDQVELLIARYIP